MTVRRISLVAGIALGIIWSVWRLPHIADDVRYALQPEWQGTELALADAGTVEIDGRAMKIEGFMGVDCMPGVRPLPIPAPDCSDPGMSARIIAKGPPAELPRFVHVRVDSLGVRWVSDMIDIPHERRYDGTFETQYAAAFALRERPPWKGRRPIHVSLWLEHRGQLYRVTLPPSEILVAS